MNIKKVRPLTLAAIIVSFICGLVQVYFSIRYGMIAKFGMMAYCIISVIIDFILCGMNVVIAKGQCKK